MNGVFVQKTIPVGIDWFAITKGQIDLIDILRQSLAYTGASEVDIVTWTVGLKSIGDIHKLLKNGHIITIRFVIDRSYGARNEAYRQELCKVIGVDNIRVTSCHAKMITIHNDKHSVAIIGSMNLNRNKRFECVSIRYDTDIVECIRSFVDGWFETNSNAGVFNNWGLNSRVFDKFGKVNEFLVPDIIL